MLGRYLVYLFGYFWFVFDSFDSYLVRGPGLLWGPVGAAARETARRPNEGRHSTQAINPIM